LSNTSLESRVAAIRKQPLPTHVAVVPDGNGRWAVQRGLPRIAGHRAGVETLKRIVRFAGRLDIKYFTVYAFSTENWRRPREEVDGLWWLLTHFLESGLCEIVENRTRLKVIGVRQNLSRSIIEAIERAEKESAAGDQMTLVIALNYGGRADIVTAAQGIAREVQRGCLHIDDIDEVLFSDFLQTKGLPEPDIIIRSSGELRISNFLLWESAYSEFVVSPVLWPDFDESEFASCIEQFQARDRRYGGTR